MDSGGPSQPLRVGIPTDKPMPACAATQPCTISSREDTQARWQHESTWQGPSLSDRGGLESAVTEPLRPAAHRGGGRANSHGARGKVKRRLHAPLTADMQPKTRSPVRESVWALGAPSGGAWQERRGAPQAYMHSEIDFKEKEHYRSDCRTGSLRPASAPAAAARQPSLRLRIHPFAACFPSTGQNFLNIEVEHSCAQVRKSDDSRQL